MKKFIPVLLCMLSLTWISVSAEAIEKMYLISFSETTNLEQEDIELHPNKQRSPATQKTGTITSEGIDIPGVASNDIYLYEVYSEEGESMATFASESDFIAYIFATGQTIEIRLYTDGYLLRGFLYR